MKGGIFIKEFVFDYTKFAELLERDGVNTKYIADVTGISPSSFTDWKQGKTFPKIDKIMKLSEFFDVPLTYFIKAVEKEEKV